MIINFTLQDATVEQGEAGVWNGSNGLRNYIRSALKVNHPSSGRAKLVKTAYQMVDRIVSDTALTHIQAALLPNDGNMVPHLADQCRRVNIRPYQWVGNTLREVPDDC